MQPTPSEIGIDRLYLTVRPWEGLLLGLAAAGIIWGAIHAVHPVFRVSKKFDVPRIGMPTELFLAHRREQDRLDRWHAAMYLGGLGFLIAGAIALRMAVARRSWWPPFLAAPLAACGGAIGGVLGCMVLQYVRTNIGQADLLHTVMAQVACGVPLGLGAGLGVGLATKTVNGTAKYAIAGLLGGAAAAVVYAVVVSLCMPETSTDTLLPEGAATRLLWIAIFAGAIGLVTPLAGRQRAVSS